MDVEREIEALYAVPLEDFTRARNDLAKELAGSGQTEEAARVKKLKKPSIPAWAVNQLSRRDAEGMRRLLELVEELRGARSAQEIHELSSERRDLVARMARTAGQLLEDAGHAASGPAMQRITQTLQAGGEPSERQLLARGILSAELSAAGFDALSGSDEVSFEDAPSGRGGDDAGAEEAEQLTKAANEAEVEAAELTRAAEEAEAVAALAAEKASEARKRARELRDKARRAARRAR